MNIVFEEKLLVYVYCLQNKWKKQRTLNVNIVNITELTHFAGEKEDFLSNEAKKKSFVMLNIELL